MGKGGDTATLNTVFLAKTRKWYYRIHIPIPQELCMC